MSLSKASSSSFASCSTYLHNRGLRPQGIPQLWATVSIFEHHFKSNKTGLFIPRHTNNMWQVVIPVLLPEGFTGAVICNYFKVMWLVSELNQSGISFRDQGLQLLSRVYYNLFPLILWVSYGRMIRLVIIHGNQSLADTKMTSVHWQ